MDLDRYLERIEHSGGVAPDLATLSSLHTAHVCSVPFENLDVQFGRPLTTRVEEAYKKIVTRRRGGWCYEQNGLFGWALSQMGFRVTRMAAAVRRPTGQKALDANHLCLLVDSDCLEYRYLVDVGFGGSMVSPIVLEETEECQPPFRLGLRRLDDGRWKFWEATGLAEFGFDFSTTAACEQRLTDACSLLQSDPASSFVLNLVVQLRSRSEHRTLRGRVFTSATAAGKHTETLGSPSALVNTLADKFRLDVPEAAGLWSQILTRHDELHGSHAAT